MKNTKVNQNITNTLEFYDYGDGVEYEIWRDTLTNKFYHVPIEINRDWSNIKTI
jgi:hypothetical protein